MRSTTKVCTFFPNQTLFACLTPGTYYSKTRLWKKFIWKPFLNSYFDYTFASVAFVQLKQCQKFAGWHLSFRETREHSTPKERGKLWSLLSTALESSDIIRFVSSLMHASCCSYEQLLCMTLNNSTRYNEVTLLQYLSSGNYKRWFNAYFEEWWFGTNETPKLQVWRKRTIWIKSILKLPYYYF